MCNMTKEQVNLARNFIGNKFTDMSTFLKNNDGWVYASVFYFSPMTLKTECREALFRDYFDAKLWTEEMNKTYEKLVHTCYINFEVV